MGKMVIDKACIGNTEVDKIYLGSEPVYEKTKPVVKQDGAYIMLQDWSEVTLYEWENQGKPDAKGILVACDGRRLMVDHNSFGLYEMSLSSLGNTMMTTESVQEASTDMSGFANCTDALANDPYFQEIVMNTAMLAPDGVNTMIAVPLSFGEIVLFQRFGEQFANIWVALTGEWNFQIFWTSTRYDNDNFWFIEDLVIEDFSTQIEAANAIIAGPMPRDEILPLLPVYDLDFDWGREVV